MFEYRHKVQYYETDKMAVVHHSNYIRWFEEARLEMMDQLGMSYFEMESLGIISPVSSVKCDYKAVTCFGDTVKILISAVRYNGVRFTVEYEVRDIKTDEIRATGETTSCFVSSSGKLLNLKKSHPEIDERLKKGIEERIL